MKKTTIAIAFALGTTIGLEHGAPDLVHGADAQTPVRLAATPVKPVLSRPTDASRALQRIEEGLRFETGRARSVPGWTPHRNIAQLHLGRARLIGSAEDYPAAEEAMREAFDEAEEGTGPFLARASLNMTIHRVDRVEADLERFERRIVIKPDERARVAGLRGDVAMLTGPLERASRMYHVAEELDPTMSSAAGIGNYELKMGDYDEARVWYRRALERTRPGTLQRAWSLLHLGIVELESNHLDEAARFYARADEAFSGWYLIEEHIAEAMLLRGDIDGAIGTYRDILERVPNGAFYAALADAYDARGDAALAAQAREDAAAAFERDIDAAPTAVSAHAIEFYLATDPSRALALARENFATRPGPEARVRLAQALLRLGDTAKAARVLTPVTETRWATLDYLATASLAFAESSPVLAAAARHRAEQVDPAAVTKMAIMLEM